VKLAIVSPVRAANISLRIAPFLPEMPRRNPCDSSACLPPRSSRERAPLLAGQFWMYRMVCGCVTAPSAAGR
jgi:hypothetical protein